MKILLLANHTKGNDGWSRYSVNLRDALQKRNHEVEIITPPPPLSFLTRPWLALFLAWRISRIMKRHAVDVLHIAVEPYALAVPFLPRKVRDRTVLTIHGNYGIRPFRLFFIRWMMKRAFAKIPRFITVSEYTKKVVKKELERMRNHHLVQYFEERATVIHNGIPLPLSSSEPRTRLPDGQEAGRIEKQGQLLDSSSASADSSLEENIKHILHVGGVKPAKGVGEAIEACAIYREKYGTPFHFTIIGKLWRDHYVQGLKLEIKQKNLNDAVSFRGMISDAELIEEYTKADLLLVPSVTVSTTFEGFGLVYLEANAYGVPVIGPNTSGAAEAIKDGVSGYTVNVLDPESIADRMHAILDEGTIDPAACRRWAEEHSIERVASKVEEVYKQIQK